MAAWAGALAGSTGRAAVPAGVADARGAWAAALAPRNRTTTVAISMESRIGIDTTFLFAMGDSLRFYTALRDSHKVFRTPNWC